MSSMTKAQRDTFLRETRIATLVTLNEDGSPNALPLWYDWDGERLRMFSQSETGKLCRLKRDPRACVSVADPVGALEAWVTVEGTVEMKEEGGRELALRLAERYYSLDRAAAHHSRVVEARGLGAARVDAVTHSLLLDEHALAFARSPRSIRHDPSTQSPGPRPAPGRGRGGRTSCDAIHRQGGGGCGAGRRLRRHFRRSKSGGGRFQSWPHMDRLTTIGCGPSRLQQENRESVGP